MESTKTFFFFILGVTSLVLFALFAWSAGVHMERVVYTEKKCECEDKQQRKISGSANVTKPTQTTTHKLTTTTTTTTTTQLLTTRKPAKTHEELWSEIANKYHTYVNTVQIKCNSIVRMGSAGDGGWDVCNDEKYRPRQPCLIYSFGINNDWTFDDAVSKTYGCHVHAFDPSMKQHDHNRTALIHFHRLGIADRKYVNNLGWQLDTLGGIRNSLGHKQTKLSILKIDTEKAELSSIPQMINEGSINDVSQFVFEIHLRMNARDEPEPDIAKYEMGLRLLDQLYKAGFRIFKTHKNPFSRYTSRFGPSRSGCHEIGLIRV